MYNQLEFHFEDQESLIKKKFWLMEINILRCTALDLEEKEDEGGKPVKH